MAQTTLGKITITPMGAYDVETTYARLDVITYANESWLVLKSCTGVTPVEGEYYMLLVSGKTAFASAVEGGYADDEEQFYIDLAKAAVATNTDGEITLADNTIYSRGEISALTLPVITASLGYTSTIAFTSGATPTTVSDSTGAIWAGDSVVWDTVNEIYVFTPVANKRYTIAFMHDGVNLCGYVLAVAA